MGPGGYHSTFFKHYYSLLDGMGLKIAVRHMMPADNADVIANCAVLINNSALYIAIFPNTQVRPALLIIFYNLICRLIVISTHNIGIDHCASFVNTGTVADD